jgi:ABC-type transport system involved in multi-copper enzyme maturation permease subunit
MLISDLSKEEQRGTLNFPSSHASIQQSILTGKMLGVPILLYLVGFLAYLYIWQRGYPGEISFGMILGVYAVLGASCLFFYSVALLFGLLALG